jgi:hypothetical protein
VERLKSGDLKLSEIGRVFSEISKRVEERMQKMREIDQQIQEEKLIIEKLEREKLKLKNEIRDLHVLLSEIQDAIKVAMGFATVSKISGKPIAMNSNSNKGKGFRVHVKTTESGIKAGLMNVNAEFSSMAKAVYALQPSMLGKRTDFKAKLEKWAKDGLIELQFL